MIGPGLALLLAVVQGVGAAENGAVAGGDAPRLRVLEAGEASPDGRLLPARTLNDAHHPWDPPPSLGEWEREARALREQILVASGLWPLPAAVPPDTVIHGRVTRDDYTVEKVSFTSRPGHVVSGSLYRPRDGVGTRGADGRRAAVLAPHGHWADGRFLDAGLDAARQEIASGAESLETAARFPLQARMVRLARMGCVVFHYDMVGYASSRVLQHRAGFRDASAALHLHNLLGIQTLNSIRALDFLSTLPEVDPQRIGVAGASGGGTQTFVLCALDPRPAAAFPMVMVSTGMQGGCVCENACYLRLGTNNAAIASLFAPRPMGLSGADDWTIDIEWRGGPQMREVWSLYDRADRLWFRCAPQFGHNANAISRGWVADWFRQHLSLGDEAEGERDFVPVSREDMEVFDSEHPLPDQLLDAAALRAAMRDEDRRVLEAALGEGGEAYRALVGTAARVFFGDGCREPDLRWSRLHSDSRGPVRIVRALLGREGEEDAVPFVAAFPAAARSAVLLLHPEGKRALLGDDGAWSPAVARWLSCGRAVLAPDVLGVGEAAFAAGPPTVDASFPGYTFGYERPLLAQRVRDTVTALRAAHSLLPGVPIDLLGLDEAGPWALLARALWMSEHPGDEAIHGRTLVDLGAFPDPRGLDAADPRFLPGILRYGNWPGLAALAVPAPLELFGAAREGVDWSLLERRVADEGSTLRLERRALDLELAAEVLADR